MEHSALTVDGAFFPSLTCLLTTVSSVGCRIESFERSMNHIERVFLSISCHPRVLILILNARFDVSNIEIVFIEYVFLFIGILLNSILVGYPTLL